MKISNRSRTSCLIAVAGVLLLPLTTGQIASAQELDLAIGIENGSRLAREALAAADRNGDGKVSPDEVA